MARSITSLVVQKRNKSRVNVFIDGEFAFGLSAIKAIELRKGQQLTEDDIARLKYEDGLETAYERALNFLSYRPRSVREVRQRLQSKDRDLTEEILDKVVARLERAGLLDDTEFAHFWVSNREEFKPRSARMLRYELYQKGVRDEHIDAALEAFDEDDAALRAAQAHVRSWREQDEQRFNKRLGDFLARRGFNYDTAREVTAQVWAELWHTLPVTTSDDSHDDG